MYDRKNNVYTTNTLHNHIKKEIIIIKTIPINYNPHEFAKEQKNMDDGYHQ
jgi:hypothetical protein